MNQGQQVPVEKGQQQRADVMPIRVGIHQQDHPTIPQIALVVVLARPAPQRRQHILELLVAEHLLVVRLFYVEHLATKRQDRLRPPVSPLLRRAAGRVALNDEELRVVRIARTAVRQLARQVELVAHRLLTPHLVGRRTRCRTGTRGLQDAEGNGVARTRILVQVTLQLRPDQRTHRRLHLGVVQPILRLTLELRIGQEDIHDRDDAFTRVTPLHLKATRNRVVRLEVVHQRIRNAVTEARLMRPTIRRRDAIGERQHHLVGALRPLQHHIHLRAFAVRIFGRKPHQLRMRHRRARAHDKLRQVVRDPALRLVLRPRPLPLILVDHPKPGRQVGLVLQPLCDRLGVKTGLFEDLGIGPEEDGRPRPDRITHHPNRRHRDAPLVALLMPLPATLHGRDQLRRQRVHHRAAHAMQAARPHVAALLKLPARMQRREDHLQRAPLLRRVHIDRDAATVVCHAHAPLVRMKHDLDEARMPIQRLVHRIVHHLPEKVMQTARVCAADVHRRPLPHRLEPLEDSDLGGIIGLVRHGLRSCVQVSRLPSILSRFLSSRAASDGPPASAHPPLATPPPLPSAEPRSPTAPSATGSRSGSTPDPFLRATSQGTS